MASMKTARVWTVPYGELTVTAGVDEAGNPRLYPVNGMPLEAWRASGCKGIPPWLLPGEVRGDRGEFMAIWEELRELAE